MKRDNPFWSSLIWVLVGCAIGVGLVLTYQALNPTTKLSDEQLDQLARQRHR